MQEPMPADHDRSSTRALNRGNTGIGSDRKMNLAHSNTANLLTPAAVARKQTEAVIHKRGELRRDPARGIRTPDIYRPPSWPLGKCWPRKPDAGKNVPPTEAVIPLGPFLSGIKMWDPDFHGAGHAALNIQGRSKLLSPKPGETLPRYDTLEFKVRCNVNGQKVNRIVCEGVVVDPPKRRARRLTAGTAMTIIGT